MKSVTIEHPKTTHKLFKTITKAEKASQVGGAGKQNVKVKQKMKKFWMKKMQK